MKRSFRPLFFLLIFTTNALAAILPGPTLDTNKSLDPVKEIQLVFIIFSQKGTIEIVNNKEQEYILTLKNVSPKVIYFGARPARFSGQLDLPNFLIQWSKGAFHQQPPTGLLEVMNLHSINLLAQSASFAIVLHQPSYDPSTQQLSFKIRSLRGNTRDLPDLAHTEYITLLVAPSNSFSETNSHR